ncbi:unnamed protein product [Rangifer tarandus platyrhynchus]|uniref:Gasdermin pore forming domain-containing protein n=2 Tax=Rangifer tarandus platyrhynchus TaxID=3082113 RepID=A0ABN8Y0I4_RANTA|nr:unnamed protein product [Rangifer tarandus platyrhynchus]CAI9692743.1 unnamed protein product [Rangifer tarandus platyrhynchus]
MCDRTETKKRNGRNMQARDQESRNRDERQRHRLDCILTDILEPSPSVPEPVVTGKFLFSDKMVQTEAAEVDATAGLEVSASGKAPQSYECCLEVQSVTISPCDWEDLQKRKVLDQEPPFLKECRTRTDNLYVVTEVVQLINTTVLQDSSSVNGMGKLSIPWNFYVKSTGDGLGLKVRQRMLTLPQGTVMAYKRKQLVFQENEILSISDDDKQKAFSELEFLSRAKSSSRLPDFHPSACYPRPLLSTRTAHLSSLL